MELKSVSCGNCGAPLQVPGAVRFLTCNHCGSSLEIKHTDSVTYSEKIAQIDERTERLEQKLEILELERELDQIDSRWQATREKLMVSNKDGGKRVPTTGGALIGVTVSTIFGLVFVGGGLSSGNGVPLAMGTFVIVIGGCVAIFAFTKAGAYADAERRYRSHRREVEDRLAAARGEPSPLPGPNA